MQVGPLGRIQTSLRECFNEGILLYAKNHQPLVQISASWSTENL